ncbi:MAG: cytochrome ubiquinol oxidase subunit I [Firmicutes bacterium]|nr:cytochrome ubiquinol oxidase subunit I [Bacillota bacterium]
MPDPALWSRALFGMSLGFHIVFATVGVGLPLMVALAEVLALRRQDPYYRAMARRWAAAFSVFLGAGVVSGTIVAVQLSLLWPTFMRIVGQIIALPFAIEVSAFFIEAVFTVIYVLAGHMIPAGWRIFSAFAVALGAAGSAVLITDVNAFMNTPTGFRLEGGQLTDIHPWRAMFNPSMPSEISHVLATAYMTVAFVLAGFACWGLGRVTSDEVRAYHARALSLSMAVASAGAFLTALTGDGSGKFLAAVQPLKFAAAEGLFRTTSHAPLVIGGFPDAVTQTVRGGIEVPGMLSWLATGNRNGTVLGLQEFPRSEWPPLFVHLLFDVMVVIGGLALFVSALYWFFRLRRFSVPPHGLRTAVMAMGPLMFLGIEAGWVFAEIGRQPWTITGLLKTSDAVTSSSAYVTPLFFLFLGLYAVLAAGAAFALRRYVVTHPLPDFLHAAGLGVHHAVAVKGGELG